MRIIHAVVPTWVDGKHDEYLLLSATYISALQIADKLDCKSVAFPLLASGNNGFDTGLALDIAVESIESYEPFNELASACIVVYGMNATQLAEDRGYDVEKNIDQVYVPEHSKDQIPQTKPTEVTQLGKDFVKQLAEDSSVGKVGVTAASKVSASTWNHRPVLSYAASSSSASSRLASMALSATSRHSA